MFIKKWKLKLGTKINFIVLAVILFLSAVTGAVVVHQITAGIEEVAVEKAKGDVELAYRYIANKYPGDWAIQNGKLYKGSTLINDNFDSVDKIGNDTRDTVTIFQGDTRVSTNVMRDGQRAVGTKVSEAVADVVLKKGEPYYGEANVAGRTFQTAYKPIKNANGETIGIFYVGASQEMIDTMVTSFLKVFIAVLAVIIVISTLSILWFTNRLKKRLTAISTALDRAGNGDFTTRVTDGAGDELSDLANSFNRMRENLRSMVIDVVQTSEHVASSSKELTAGAEQSSKAAEEITEVIQQVASGAESQTIMVEESEKALEEVTIGIQNIAETSADIAEKGKYATDRAKQGVQFVEGTAEQMNAIHQSVNESGEAIRLLDQRSREIGEISTLITDIANRTNLLALNAAIEAARAGVHGKGFAVVADEVRKLAEQSQQSSAQISELIQEIQHHMGRSTHSITQVKSEVQDGLVVVKKTQESFKEIHQSMERIGAQIDEMAATAEQMSASAQEVSATVAGITKISKDNAGHTHSVAASTEEQLASMEEITASANTLSNMAMNLQKQMSSFKV
ncbi:MULTISPECIES: methyl-accepting chemotaxis protein [unclassified Paenibacillus]|uniref:methyl-accepting chemotaxis protein n=1 Tax=unclassified Paenibacillus TaxID=185978 RepID=UPI001AE30869|nr:MULTISPECIES: methyl-accepting chemotaxis protein [unclassified Paenibacillus]MBP1153348.1 methyl-accepting chemotaxis protein [Paenibacillus sp. PvP091]MBP1171269.1 methyl-accepting chemotaxis protein [Paenibacillus sp. PvR098]MBP2442297.1 methyl-accepting chemotaxis protein [Paenibacillus sp. PvP052]